MKKFLSIIGPGLVTAALVFGPSKMTITSKMGADFGYALLWVVGVAIFFMAVFTAISEKLGASNGDTLLEMISIRWGKGVSVGIGIGIFLVCTSFQAGNATGIGIAMGEATGTAPWIWILVFNGIGLSLLFFRSFYRMLETLMISLVVLMLLCFLVTLFWSAPDPVAIVKGFVPTVPDKSLPLMIAFIASCFSLVGAFYQAYLVQERKKAYAAKAQDMGLKMEGNPKLPTFSEDSRNKAALQKGWKGTALTGIILLGVMSAVVIVAAAAVLFPKQQPIKTAAEMGLALEPLFGAKASIIFLIGLFGASFSSLVGNAVLGGSLLGDALGWKGGFSHRGNKILIALVMMVGASIALIFGKLPLELIIFAQSITILIVPFIGYVLLKLGTDPQKTGQEPIPVWMKTAAYIGWIILILLALKNIHLLFIAA